jgi:hypothetical protein
MKHFGILLPWLKGVIIACFGIIYTELKGVTGTRRLTPLH